MFIWIADYTTIDYLDVDLNEDMDLEQLASPQFFDASASLTDEWLAKLRAAAEEEYAGPRRDDEDEDLDKVNWEIGGWVFPDVGRPNMTMFGKNGSETVVMVVIQRVEV